MKNLRIEPKGKFADTFGTGDHQRYEVYQIVRDYDITDIYDKEYKRGKKVEKYFTAEVITMGYVVETVSQLEYAEYILKGLKDKFKNK